MGKRDLARFIGDAIVEKDLDNRLGRIATEYQNLDTEEKKFLEEPGTKEIIKHFIDFLGITYTDTGTGTGPSPPKWR